MKTKLQRLWRRITSSPRLTEDDDRKKVILNIILRFSVAAFILINGLRIFDYIADGGKSGLPLWSTLLILAFLVWLTALSRRGRIKLASILLISLYSLPMLFCLIVWGADLPAGLLLAVLVIAMSVALLGAHSAFSVTFMISALLITLTGLQGNKTIIVKDYWRQEANQIEDAIVYSLLLLIIAGIAWLFAHGIKQALTRAQISEMALKEERDLLEIKVKERTEALRLAEQEKIDQLYRLAEFGRLSSGIFHDLINPLTAVSLNLEQIKEEAGDKEATGEEIFRAKSYLGQALLSAKKMESLIAGIKKQIQKEDEPIIFSLNKEIAEIIQIFAYRARKAQVTVDFQETENCSFRGNALKFSQIMSNLLANAIDASENRSEAKNIRIDLERRNDKIIIMVEDQGIGIAPENIDRIFERFFSTKKKSGQGLGIGLAMTKDLIEKTFGGTIEVISRLEGGSLFTVSLPVNLIK